MSDLSHKDLFERYEVKKAVCSHTGCKDDADHFDKKDMEHYCFHHMCEAVQEWYLDELINNQERLAR